jgi:hypothetical protein
MALGRPTRDQVFLDRFDNLPNPTIMVGSVEHRNNGEYPLPNVDASLAIHGSAAYYIPLNPELWKSYVAVPTNQGQRGGIASRQTMMFDPRNSPSRSQMSEGYTIPIQQFGAQILWETPSGQHTAGQNARQPSTKFASPFSTTQPIPTRMPWDL